MDDDGQESGSSSNAGGSGTDSEVPPSAQELAMEARIEFDATEARKNYFGRKDNSNSDPVVAFYEQFKKFFKHVPSTEQTEQKVAAVIVAHPVDTLPYLIEAAYDNIGPVACVIEKGTKNVVPCIDKIRKHYEELIDDDLSRDTFVKNGNANETGIKEFIQRYLSEKSPWVQKGYKLVLLDHGGYFANIYPYLKEDEKANLLGICEHTKNGEVSYMQQSRDGPLPYLVYSNASTPLKKREDAPIADSCVKTYRAELESHGRTFDSATSNNEHLLLVGYGRLGSKIVGFLVAHGFGCHIDIVDISESAEGEAKTFLSENNHSGTYNRVSVLKPDELFRRDILYNYVLLSAGKNCFGPEHIGLLANEAYLAFVTSPDKLLKPGFFEILKEGTGEKSCEFARRDSGVELCGKYYANAPSGDKVIHLIGKCHPVNFIQGSSREYILHPIIAGNIRNAYRVIQESAARKEESPDGFDTLFSTDPFEERVLLQQYVDCFVDKRFLSETNTYQSALSVTNLSALVLGQVKVSLRENSLVLPIFGQQGHERTLLLFYSRQSTEFRGDDPFVFERVERACMELVAVSPYQILPIALSFVDKDGYQVLLDEMLELFNEISEKLNLGNHQIALSGFGTTGYLVALFATTYYDKLSLNEINLGCEVLLFEPTLHPTEKMFQRANENRGPAPINWSNRSFKLQRFEKFHVLVVKDSPTDRVLTERSYSGVFTVIKLNSTAQYCFLFQTPSSLLDSDFRKALGWDKSQNVLEKIGPVDFYESEMFAREITADMELLRELLPRLQADSKASLKIINLYGGANLGKKHQAVMLAKAIQEKLYKEYGCHKYFVTADHIDVDLDSCALLEGNNNRVDRLKEVADRQPFVFILADYDEKKRGNLKNYLPSNGGIVVVTSAEVLAQGGDYLGVEPMTHEVLGLSVSGAKAFFSKSILASKVTLQFEAGKGPYPPQECKNYLSYLLQQFEYREQHFPIENWMISIFKEQPVSNFLPETTVQDEVAEQKDSVDQVEAPDQDEVAEQKELVDQTEKPLSDYKPKLLGLLMPLLPVPRCLLKTNNEWTLPLRQHFLLQEEYKGYDFRDKQDLHSNIQKNFYDLIQAEVEDEGVLKHLHYYLWQLTLVLEQEQEKPEGEKLIGNRHDPIVFLINAHLQLMHYWLDEDKPDEARHHADVAKNLLVDKVLKINELDEEISPGEVAPALAELRGFYWSDGHYCFDNFSVEPMVANACDRSAESILQKIACGHFLLVQKILKDSSIEGDTKNRYRMLEMLNNLMLISGEKFQGFGEHAVPSLSGYVNDDFNALQNILIAATFGVGKEVKEYLNIIVIYLLLCRKHKLQGKISYDKDEYETANNSQSRQSQFILHRHLVWSCMTDKFQIEDFKERAEKYHVEEKLKNEMPEMVRAMLNFRTPSTRLK